MEERCISSHSAHVKSLGPMASILAGASNFTISGGTFSINQNSSNVAERTSALGKLSAAAAHSAMHDAPARTDSSRCHQHTRINVLDHLERWAQGICDEGAPVFWLHGGAGAGKSAIMQSLAERCVAQKIALGGFFFSRGDPTRNTAEVLIPTLAYQLAQSFPLALDVLEHLINANPLIFKKSLEVQISTLFLCPLQHLRQLGIISDVPQSPRVFLIDGLDECNDPVQQQAIIQAIAVVCYEHRLPVKFLIASRPEVPISTAFRWYEQSHHLLGTISLSDDADAQADIRLFIEDELSKVRLRHPFHHMIPSEWPDASNIDRLVGKSSSHFIYAATAMRYIWSPMENPVRSLQNVLSLQISRTISPFAELDALYRHIIGNAAHRDKVLQILACRMFAPFCWLYSEVRVICLMANCSLDDLSVFMADMAPLVALPESSGELQILHATLRDFLCDQSRSGPLYIDRGDYLVSNLEYCFGLIHHVCQKENTSLPKWHMYSPPLGVIDRELVYWVAFDQVIRTIEAFGNVPATQEFLKQYSLRNFYEHQLSFRHLVPDTVWEHFELYYLFRLLIAVHSTNTYSGVSAFSGYLENFIDILESHVTLVAPLLAPAILPLLFCGYRAEDLRKILHYHCRGAPSSTPQIIAHQWFKESTKLVPALNFISTAGHASVRYAANTSPECLAIAAQIILGYLIDDTKLHPPCTLTYLPHRTRSLRIESRQSVVVGAPSLASGFCAQWRGLHRSGRRREKPSIIVELLHALLLVLPKAGFSDEILRYSRKTFPWYMYHHDAGLCRSVRSCLDRYATRVQNAKLEELNRRIEDGHVNALIEKSRILDLNAQD